MQPPKSRKGNAARPGSLAMTPEIWRHIFDAVDDPVFLHDGQFRLLLANRAYCRAAGVSEAEALGKPYWEVFPPGTGPLPGCKDAATGTGHTGSREPVGVGEKHFLSTGYTVRDNQGKTLYALHVLSDTSERKRAEDALRKSKDLLQSIIENVPDRIFWKDRDSRYLGCNTPFAQDAGCSSPEELIGKTDFEMTWKDQAEAYRADDQAVMESGTPKLGYEEPQTTPNGDTIWLRTSKVPLRDGSGQVIGILGIYQDTTERRRTEQSLKNMAAKYRTIYESSSDAIILLDGGIFFDCNPATLRMFGCSTRDEFIGKHPAELSPPTQPGGEDSMSLANQRIATAFNNGNHLFEWTHRRLDGTEFPAEVSLAAMELDGRPVLQGSVRDTSERKRAQASELRYRRLFESAKDGILILDAETGMIVDANPFMTEILGYSHEELLGKHVWDLGFMSNAVANQGKFLELQQQEYVRYEDLPLETTQGQMIHVEFVSNVYRVDDTRVIQCNIRNITRRWRAEEKNRRTSQMYRTISRCNEALVRAPDELALTGTMCRILTEEGGFPMAWVGYAEQGAANIRPVASAGIEAGWLESLNPGWTDEGGQAPVAAAIRTGQAVISNDTGNDMPCASGQGQASQRGCLTVAAIPFELAPQGLGVLVVYGTQPDEFTEDIIKLLTELAYDLAFGIGNLRSRAERLGILEKLEHSLDHAVAAIAATVEMRDPYTAGHQRRVAKLATAIAVEMGLPDDQVQGLHVACVVHDIGKIHVPAEILSSPNKLTDAEFEIIKTHPQVGREILKGIEFPWPVAEIVHQHHERQDGSGYPRGLKGDGILLEARILAVADVVEAMTSHRPYRPGFGIFPALQEISRSKGKLYDAAVVDACLRLFMERDYAW